MPTMPETHSPTALIATPHPAATIAGRAVLARDGTAIEAALAAAAMLTAVAPDMTGLGGDALWLIAEPDGRTRALLGIGQAAASARPAPTPRGPGACITTPGAVASWGEAFVLSREHWGGRENWEELIAPAQMAAERGIIVSDSLHWWQRASHDALRAQPGYAACFTVAGRVPEPGSRLRLPALARSLALLARNGAEDFYRGTLAHMLADGLGRAGVAITATDLAACQARWEAPLSLSLDATDILTAPPPSQGVVTLQILGLLDRLGHCLTEPGSAADYHLMIEASKLALTERNRCLSDPLVTGFDAAALLTPEALAARAGRVRPDAALPWPVATGEADTVWLGVVDAKGRAVSMLQSVFLAFGSGVVAGETGILWHNRGIAFAAAPDHPNALAPGKRPLHTLTPVLLRDAAGLRGVLGTQGGDGQPQTLTVLLTRLLGLGLAPAAALAWPRFLFGRTALDSEDRLRIEADAGAAALAGLGMRGHAVESIAPRSPLMGRAGIIRVGADGLLGAHDPRGEGTAEGC